MCVTLLINVFKVYRNCIISAKNRILWEEWSQNDKFRGILTFHYIFQYEYQNLEIEESFYCFFQNTLSITQLILRNVDVVQLDRKELKKPIRIYYQL